MSVTRELLRLVGGKKEWVNIGALAQNVKEDKNHRFVTDEEKKSWNEKPSKDGDMAESTVSSLEEAQASFPQPAAGDNQKTLWGKLKKWQQDCIAKFGNYVLTSMITNQHLNSTSNIPTSALVYLMQQAIQQNQSAINVLNTKLFYNKEVYGLNIPQNAGNIGTAVIWRNASPTDNYGTIIGDYNNQINTELKLLNGEVWLIRTNADETKTEKLIAKL